MPSEAESGTQLECPVCEVEFSFDSIARRELPFARVAQHARGDEFDQPGDESAADPLAPTESARPTAEESLSRLLRGAANWKPAAATRPEPSHLHDAFAASRVDDDSAQQASNAGSPSDAHSPVASDALQLGSSRLDQLLSDLMQRPPQAIAASDDISGVYVEVPPLAFPDPALNEAQDRTADPDRERDGARGELPHELNGRLSAGNVAEPFALSPETSTAPQRDSNDVEPMPNEPSHLNPGHVVSLDLYAPQPRRRRALAAAMVGVALLLLNYGLLWLRGPAGDFLAMARWLPAAAVPAAAPAAVASAGENAPQAPARSPAITAAARLAASTTPPPQNDDGAPAAADESQQRAADSRSHTAAARPPRRDPAVSPATATEPAGGVASASLRVEVNWPTTPVVGDLRGVKLYTVAEIKAVAAGVDSAHRQFLAGDLAHPESRSVMGQAYMDVCALAERFTLADPEGYSNELVTEQLVAKEVFRGMAGDPQRRSDLQVVSARWLQHERRPNQGIVLLGRVSDMRPQGRWTEYIVDVGSGDAAEQCLVLLDRIRFPIGAELAVAGVIIAQPQQRLAGYQGDAEQVVVAGFAFPPKDFSRPPAAEPLAAP
ncbi:MAG: hypothetical protein DCC67_04315 [Planctomycetota bacterium]|nr:MAG: hypothetical protein DCC67_04315 [Planctomycetota bacterium]